MHCILYCSVSVTKTLPLVSLYRHPSRLDRRKVVDCCAAVKHTAALAHNAAVGNSHRPISLFCTKVDSKLEHGDYVCI